MDINGETHIATNLQWDLLRAGVVHLLSEYADHAGYWIDSDSYQSHPDVFITDEKGFMQLMMSSKDTKEDTQHKTAILLVTAIKSPFFVRMTVRQGVRGYVCLNDQLEPRLATAVKAILDGSTYLSPSAAQALDEAYVHDDLYSRITPYNIRILYLMGQHQSGIEIAQDMHRSPTAIHKIQSHLRQLFGVKSNSELLVAAYECGLLLSAPAIPFTVETTGQNSGISRIG
ncbi:MAG: response regulator transcription factor [Anaerolineae bacterium]|nr:response regulator transcription factor [Anaerolineae bacterium]